MKPERLKEIKRELARAKIEFDYGVSPRNTVHDYADELIGSLEATQVELAEIKPKLKMAEFNVAFWNNATKVYIEFNTKLEVQLAEAKQGSGDQVEWNTDV